MRKMKLTLPIWVRFSDFCHFTSDTALYNDRKEPFWALVILLGSMINFFNLIPVSPLDGGRIISVISTKIWGAGLILLLGYSIYFKSILGGFIVIIGCMELYRVIKR